MGEPFAGVPDLEPPLMPDATREQQYESLSRQHGGYWRHRFIDHAYLYNLHFPPETFFEHLARRIRDLVLNYPVGQGRSCGSGWRSDRPALRTAGRRQRGGGAHQDSLRLCLP